MFWCIVIFLCFYYTPDCAGLLLGPDRSTGRQGDCCRLWSLPFGAPLEVAKTFAPTVDADGGKGANQSMPAALQRHRL